MTALIDATTAADVIQLKKDAFDTALLVSQTASLVLYRDSEQDGTGASVGVQSVRVVMYSKPGQGGYVTTQGPGARVVIESGEFQKKSTFNVQAGDRFTLNGIAGTITAVYPPDVRDVIRAAFELER